MNIDKLNEKTFSLGLSSLPKLKDVAKKINEIISWLLTDYETISFACSDETTVIQSGNAKITFHAPYNFTLLSIFAGLTTPEPSGQDFLVDVNKNGASVLSTKISIEATEETSLTSASQPVISTSSFTKGDKITIDVDQIGDPFNAAATGLKVYMKVTRL